MQAGLTSLSSFGLQVYKDLGPVLAPCHARPCGSASAISATDLVIMRLLVIWMRLNMHGMIYRSHETKVISISS